MIKRRHYNLEHGDGNGPSSQSSSSDSSASESEVEAEVNKHSNASPNGYESSDDAVSQELNDDCTDVETKSNVEDGLSADVRSSQKSHKDEKCAVRVETGLSELDNHIFMLKSVYRCRICPKVVCLNEATVKEHINSKKHGRSKMLFKANKLKEMLNVRGEIENQETAAELHARIMSLSQTKAKKKRKLDSKNTKKPKSKSKE